jgi:uncharacterized protein DUF3891
MIIRRNSDSFVCIRQPDHAKLAAIIISAWQRDGFPTHARRDVILLAAREHDNGWLEEDADTHVAPDGTPLDFVAVPAAAKHRIWPRAVGRLAPVDSYAAALVAEHALTVHADHRSKPEWQAFFQTMEAQRGAALARTGREPDRDFTADYAFVNMADFLSLVFCNGWTERFDHAGYTVQLTGRELTVTPSAFNEPLPLRILARRVLARPYASASEFRAALDEADIEMVEGVVR